MVVCLEEMIVIQTVKDMKVSSASVIFFWGGVCVCFILRKPLLLELFVSLQVPCNVFNNCFLKILDTAPNLAGRSNSFAC